MEQEFIEHTLPHKREDELHIYYKGMKLRHMFNAVFTLFENIIVEVKSGDEGIIEKTISQILNSLKASGCRVGLIVNFDKTGLEYKRLIM